jgi:hypothetical protein
LKDKMPERKIAAVFPVPEGRVWAVCADLWDDLAGLGAIEGAVIVPVLAWALLEEAGVPALHATPMLEGTVDRCYGNYEAEFQDVYLAGERRCTVDLVAADWTADMRCGLLLLDVVTEYPHPENYGTRARIAIDRAMACQTAEECFGACPS